MELKCLVLQLVVSAAFLLIANASACTDGDTWTAPSGWAGPAASYYKSFDNTNCMTLHNGASLVSGGKRGKAVATNHKKKQFVDLGVIADKACIVSPSTCSSGGTISAWVVFRRFFSIHFSSTRYAMTSFDEPERKPHGKGYLNSYEGFSMRRLGSGYIAALLMSDSHLSGHMTNSRIKKGAWFHVTIVYHANTKKQDTYINGRLGYKATKDSAYNNHQNTGKLVIGRKFAVEEYKKMDNTYGSVSVDELVAFNSALTPEQVKDLYDSY